MSRLARNVAGLAFLVIGGFVVKAASDSAPGSDFDVAYRTFKRQQCADMVPAGIDDLSDYATWLRTQSARLNVNVEDLQTLLFMQAEQRHPGVGERCARAYP